jgi:hypothetical protein
MSRCVRCVFATVFKFKQFLPVSARRRKPIREAIKSAAELTCNVDEYEVKA